MYIPSKDRYTEMTYPRCGKSGLRLPRVSLGLWHNFGETGSFDHMKDMIFTAFDRGITHFDLANNYGPPAGAAEERFGRILREELRPYRDEMILSTKAGYYMWEGPYGDGGSRKYLLASLDQSLLRMGVDYVDIFYHHRMDKETPLEETVWALDRAVKSGKALYVGLSNYDGETMKTAAAMLRELHCPFVINQNPYNMLNRSPEENGLLDAARESGTGVICFSPLAQGLLTDRYLGGIPSDSRIRTDGRFLRESALTEPLLKQLRALQTMAAERGESFASMSLRWVLTCPAVTSVLIGASHAGQIKDCLGVLKENPLTSEEMKKIDAITRA